MSSQRTTFLAAAGFTVVTLGVLWVSVRFEETPVAPPTLASSLESAAPETASDAPSSEARSTGPEATSSEGATATLGHASALSRADSEGPTSPSIAQTARASCSFAERPAPVYGLAPGVRGRITTMAGTTVVARAPATPSVDAAQLLASADSDVAALTQAPTLPDRFKVLNEIAGRSPDLAAPALTTLLESELPGSAYEAETLRLALLGKVAQLPGARSEALLVAALEPDRPRPERLLALEVLAPRANAGRTAIDAVARDDHDPVVQEKARALLARDR